MTIKLFNFKPRYKIDMNDQFHASSGLNWGKERPVSTVHQTGWVLGALWTFVKEKTTIPCPLLLRWMSSLYAD